MISRRAYGNPSSSPSTPRSPQESQVVEDNSDKGSEEKEWWSPGSGDSDGDIVSDDSSDDNRESQQTFHAADYIVCNFIDDGDSSNAENEQIPRSSQSSDFNSRERCRDQKRASKRRTIHRALAALRAERVGSMTWRPRRCFQINIRIGIQLKSRWRCEQLIRAHTAYNGVKKDVFIAQKLEKVSMKCRTPSCLARIVFDWQQQSGLWKFKKYKEHSNECYGQRVRDDHAMEQYLRF